MDSETDLEKLDNFYKKNGFLKVGENKYEYDPKAKDSSGDIGSRTDDSGTKKSDISAVTNKGQSDKNVDSAEEVAEGGVKAPQVTKGKPISEQIADLRKAEQAEYDAMSNPNDKAKQKEIYDRYDEKITPLLEEQKSPPALRDVESTAKALEEGDKIQWNVFGNEESGEWNVVGKTKTRGGKDAVILSKVYVEASSDGKSYTKEYADANGIKYDNERTVEHIVPLEELKSESLLPKEQTQEKEQEATPQVSEANVKAIEEAITKKSGTIKNEIIKEAADPTEVKKILDNLDAIKSKLAGFTTKDGNRIFSEECKWG